MKFTTLALLFLSCSVYGQSDFQKLIGQWEGVQGADTITIIFEKDSTVTFSNKNDEQVFGGRESVRKGKTVRTIYAVDTSLKPFGIDFIILETETKNEQARMRGIFEFASDNKIKIDFVSANSRPTVFGEFSLTMIRKE